MNARDVEALLLKLERLETGKRQYTDTSNAERLLSRYGDELRYCTPWKRWLYWDGKRWRKDDAAEILARAKEVVREMYREACRFEGEWERERQHELEHAAERTARDIPSVRAHEPEEAKNRSVRSVTLPEPSEKASLQRDIVVRCHLSLRPALLPPIPSTTKITPRRRNRCAIKTKNPSWHQERSCREATILTVPKKRMKRHFDGTHKSPTSRLSRISSATLSC